VNRLIRSGFALHRRIFVLVGIGLCLAVLSFAGWRAQAEQSHSEVAVGEMNGGADPSVTAAPVPTPEDLTSPQIKAKYRGVIPITHFDVSPPLRDITPITAKYRHPENEERDIIPRSPSVPKELQVADPVVQSFIGGQEIPAPSVTFNGPGNAAGVAPPDPNGEVGRNHVIVMVNSVFQIYNKTGTSMFGPANINTLFAGFGGACQTRNDGDPVVLYDQIADRWVMMQFTSAAPFFNCVALSQTNDPLGAYYRWAFPVGNTVNFGDYEKMGMGADAYFISTREFLGAAGAFQGVGAYALNKAQMLAGNPNPTVISFLAPPTPAYVVGDGLLPADLDGNAAPPPGTPEYFLGSQDNNGPYGAPSDGLTLWKFNVDFTTPVNSSFALANTIPVAPFNSILALCAGSRSCIQQPNTTNRLDHLGYRQRPLFRLAYRVLNGTEILLTNQSVSGGTGPSGEVAGIRWWEIRNPNTSPIIFQEGTYAPGVTDGTHRWMGSIAMDGSGNIGLGFSASSATVFPSVRYTGRLTNDPAGTMPQGEADIITGTGSQTGGGNRWGDYTDMTVDPVDDCTFYHVNEWVPTTSASGWQARVGAFKFPTCGSPTGTATGTITNCSTAAPIPGATITLNPGNYISSANASGQYIATAPPGSYTATVTAPGYGTASGPVNIVVGQNTPADFCLAPSAILTRGTVALPSSNGIVEPNECNHVNIPVTNSGTATATGVSAVLSTTTPNVTISRPNSAYPDIAPGGTQTNSVPFLLSTNGAVACFTSIDLTLTVSFTGGTSPQTFNFTLPVGQAANANYTFTASSGAVIPGVPANGVLVPGTQVDDAAAPLTVPAGFNFSVYGTPVTGGTTISVGTNGNLQFIASGGATAWTNAALPVSAPGTGTGTFPASAPTLFPYWDDHNMTTTRMPGGLGGVYTQLVGSAPNRQWVIEWRARHFDDTNLATPSINYAIVINENSDSFTYNYILTGQGATNTAGVSATVGAQAASSGTNFTQYSFNSAVITPGLVLTAVRLPGVCAPGSGQCGALAAGVDVGGRVLGPDGRGITNATVSITGPDGIAHTAITNRNGMFLFHDIEAGHSYVIAVRNRRYAFTPQVVSVTDNIGDIVFTAEH
jgi:hypothetical protein